MDRKTTIEYMHKAVACHNENPTDCLGRNCCDCPHDYPMGTIELIESALELLEGGESGADPWDGEKPHAPDGFVVKYCGDYTEEEA